MRKKQDKKYLYKHVFVCSFHSNLVCIWGLTLTDRCIQQPQRPYWDLLFLLKIIGGSWLISAIKVNFRGHLRPRFGFNFTIIGEKVMKIETVHLVWISKMSSNNLSWSSWDFWAVEWQVLPISHPSHLDMISTFHNHLQTQSKLQSISARFSSLKNIIFLFSLLVWSKNLWSVWFIW